MSSSTDYRQISYWMDSLGEEIVPRAALEEAVEVDVAIVGAGYTGLWTAYYLLESDPSLRVVVLEKEVAGYGASGRNGGWCSALFAVSDARLARLFGKEAMHAMRRAMNDTVDEVGRVASKEGIDCHFRKAGTVHAARTKAQVTALNAELAEARELGLGEEELVWVERREMEDLFSATGVLGGLFTPHCAAIHPARLARGLAACVEEKGARIYEQTEVRQILPRAGSQSTVVTAGGTVFCRSVIVATEGFTAGLPGRERSVVPIYSLMVATEPLGHEAVASLGTALEQGATFTDGRHLLIYGQVTADGRLAFGGRGAPYHRGSKVSPSFERDDRVHSLLKECLGELFPQLGEIHITHRWGGPIGVHRDWFPSVRYDEASGLGSAGGYVGDGVATTNLAGRSLADLVLGRQSDLTALPWVGHESPRWEPEPLRWAGINAGLKSMQLADMLEDRSGKPSRIAAAVGRITGA
jgi:glycine/D-amino acid oxidase-like deaminating enzyme